MKRLLRFLVITGVFSITTLVIIRLATGAWDVEAVMSVILIVVMIQSPRIMDWFDEEKNLTVEEIDQIYKKYGWK